MATLKDISRQLGLSVTTVSRALNGFPEVNEATRQTVVSTARAMNYRPNQVAQKLVSGRSGMVGLVLSASPEPYTYGHFFEIVTGLSARFSARDIDFVLNISGEADVLPHYHRLINRGTLDGFIVTVPEVADARIALLLERGVPFVVHGRMPDDDRYPYVDIDNRGLAFRLVEHLAGLGHRRIGLINGPKLLAYAHERLRGYRDGLAAHRIRLNPALIRHGIANQAHGAAAATELMRDPARRPTALICCNTLVAAAAIAAARAEGLSVPRDISVVAHDDALPQLRAAELDPPLTVTRAPLQAASDPLVDFLLRRIRGEDVARLQLSDQPELIVRASATAVARRRG